MKKLKLKTFRFDREFYGKQKKEIKNKIKILFRDGKYMCCTVVHEAEMAIISVFQKVTNFLKM